MSRPTGDVVVVGGGVIGCSIAFHLAKAGVDVTVLERGQVGSGASHAASGILSIAPGDQPYARLARQSLALFHSLAPELLKLGGVDIELVESGEVDLALDEDEAVEMQGVARQLARLGVDARWLDQGELHDLEPALSPSIAGALYMPGVCRVNNQRLAEAFARAAERLGAQVRQGVEVAGLTHQDGRVTGVRLRDGEVQAGHVVLAAGAWSQSLTGQVGVSLPVRPVRGQNLNLQPQGPSINAVVHGGGGMLVPRNDGSLVVGATVEEAGFDSRVTVEGVQSILRVATALAPSLRDASLNWAVAGLRPGSLDGAPVMGAVRGWEGLSVATGHYRNGILLSPVTGKLMADYLTGEEAELLSVFGLDRFGRAGGW